MSDVNVSDDPFRTTGAVRFGYSPSRFVLGPIGVDDDAVELNVVIQAEEDDSRVRYARVRLPLRVDGVELLVGEPELSYPDEEGRS